MIALTVATSSAAISADGLPHRARDLVPLLASCLGRYSAEIEDSWHAFDPTDPLPEQRATVEDLLDAVRIGSGIPGRRILQMRLEAKFAQARLLSTARFHQDPRIQRRARAQAAMALRPCSALIL